MKPLNIHIIFKEILERKTHMIMVRYRVQKLYNKDNIYIHKIRFKVIKLIIAIKFTNVTRNKLSSEHFRKLPNLLVMMHGLSFYRF
jgi:hypothetical protein